MQFETITEASSSYVFEAVIAGEPSGVYELSAGLTDRAGNIVDEPISEAAEDCARLGTNPQSRKEPSADRSSWFHSARRGSSATVDERARSP